MSSLWQHWNTKPMTHPHRNSVPKCERFAAEKHTKSCACMCLCMCVYVCVRVHLWPSALTESLWRRSEPSFNSALVTVTHPPNTVMKILLQSHLALTTWQISPNEIRKELMKHVRRYTNTHKTLSWAWLVDIKDWIIPLPGSTIYPISCKWGEKITFFPKKEGFSNTELL